MVVPATKQTIRFDGKEIESGSEARFLAGFGFLSDLVELYRLHGDSLFSKNVRAFLYRAQEKGPAKYMRESIRECCIPQKGEFKMEPERFALLHNGITIAARTAAIHDGHVDLREPSVINGCQTVKNAALFIEQPNVRDRVDQARFAAIRVPVRILVTKDDDLLRDVTISNNRQNAMRPSAFRANDPIQLALAERFRTVGIFYERQEQAFINLSRSNALQLQEDYGNSDDPVTMEQLAQAIALVGNTQALSTASKVSDLFEEAVYRSIFSEDRLVDLTLLVFLRNMLTVLPVVIKDVMNKARKFDRASSKKKFAYPAMRILSRYVVKYEPALVAEFGEQVIRKAGPQHPFRKRLVQLCAAQNSRLQQLFQDDWYDAVADEWTNPLDPERCKVVLRRMRLDEFDVFERWAANA